MRAEAYRSSYSADNMSDDAVYVEACRLFKNPKIALRVIMMQAEHRERHNISVDSLTMELDEAKKLAMDVKQPAAMTAAIMGKAKIHGLIKDKHELKYKGKVKIYATELDELI